MRNPSRTVPALVALLPFLTAPLHALILSEIMYHPLEADEAAYEFLELYNENADPLDLSGYRICNGVEFEIPQGTWLGGRSVIVICAKASAIQAKYGITNVLGDWFIQPNESLSLSNGGERIEVCNPGGRVVISVRYNDRGNWDSGADGTGHSLEIESPFDELDDPDSWDISSNIGGSPGFVNPCWENAGPGSGECVARVPVRLSEAYLRTVGAEARWVELWNRGGSTVSLGGYFITDDPSDSMKFTIPAATSIPAGGYLVFTEAQLGFDLSVSAPGDRRFLALVEPLPRNRFVDAYTFEPEFAGYSEARLPGDARAFSRAADPTPGAANAHSASDAVVINEIMYHPIDNDNRKEYVELHNKGGVAIDLTGWSFSSGIDFTMPGGTIIPAGGYLVIARDPELVRTIYGLGAAQVIGPATPEALDAFGVLRNSGERITLDDQLRRTVDTVRWHDGGEWPAWADGGGSSLELIDANQDNALGQAWDSSDDSSKAVTETFSYVGRHLGGESELAIVLLDRGITLVDDVSIIGGGVTNTDTPLIEVGETWRYQKGTAEPSSSWKSIAFTAAGWLSGPTGIGYGDNDDATVLGDMRNNYMTIFCRKTFTVADPASIDKLILSIIVDDGFYAYLNGTQVASYNVSSPAFDAPAPSAGEPTLIERDISAFKNLLVPGTNVLAVQVHNAGLGSSDLSFIPRLLDRTTTLSAGSEQLTNGTFNSSTSGWMIEGTHIRSGRTTQSPISGAGSLKILASSRGDNKVNRIETPNAGGTGMSNLAVNEDLAISLKARWVVGARTLLTHGYEHEMAQTHQLSVPLQLGTPGARNQVTQRLITQTGASNLGPVITDVSQEPVVPGAGESVTVTARVIDPDGLGAVTLRYSLNNPSASPASVAMTHAGDGIYEATVPAQSLGTRVVFFITAADAGGRTGRYPVDVAARTHPFLLNPPAAGLNEQRYLIYRHDVRNPATNYLSYRFYMTQANENELSNRKRLSNDQLDGSFVFGGSTIYYESKTRFSGSPWARGGWGGSFRVRMPKDDLLHGRVKKFGLEDNQGNPLDARTRISHYLIRQNQGTIGVPYTEDFALVRWQVNDRTTGTREHNWVPDAEFISRWFPEDDDGDFLEMDDRFVINDNGDRVGSTDGRVLYPPPSSRSDGDGSNKENYRWFFGLRAKEGSDEYANFMAFARVLDPGATSNAAFDEQIWDTMNVEEMLRLWAIEMNIDDWDSWGMARGKNCYFYRPEGDGRFHKFTWDVELTYGSLDSFLIPASPSEPFNPGGFAEVNRLMNRPRIKRMYYSILDEMVNGPDRWFDSAFLSDYANRLAALGMANVGIARPGGYIDQRASILRTRIRAAVYPQVRLTITTSGGNDFATAQPTVDLAGTAPADASEIYVNSDRRDVEYSSMTAWRIRGIPLVPGENELVLTGFDLRGNVVDSDSITVTRTGVWSTPSLTLINPASALAGSDIDLLGSDFHDGLQVFFGAVQSPLVVFSESGPTPWMAIARVPGGAGTVNVTVRNADGKTSNAMSFTYTIPPPVFIRGDSNGDAVVDISDAVKTLLHLFAGAVTNCEDAMDFDDNEVLNVTDVLLALGFLFQNGAAPPAPFPAAGVDPAGTILGCAR
ncbi:MAG TPA: lamin tail domain-containing protein [Planctomycetota bacterium]|nr:lamin tail domain-containing protein [Planctomycetota bacterium]